MMLKYIASLPERLTTWWRVRRCHHVLRGIDLQLRGEDGNVRWPCSECGKVVVESCGIEILKHGTLTGPWEIVKDGEIDEKNNTN